MSARDLRAAYRRFWLGFEVSATRLRLFRFLFFGVLAVDALMQLPHAPRYGAGDFNVSHLPALDGILPLPGAGGLVVIYVAISLLAARIALGAASRLSLIAITTLWGIAYFWSQLDSYQHHYLIFLLLVISCVVPWPGPGDSDPKPIAAWPVRLLLVQLSILYAFAAVAKMDPLWLDGTTIEKQIDDGAVRSMAEALGWGLSAKLVLVGELFLAVALQIRRLWPAALIGGLALHLSIQLGGFKIGLFSFFMFACYALVVPERPLSWLARETRRALGDLVGAWSGVLAPLKTTLQRPAVQLSVLAGGVMVGALLVLRAPFAEVLWAALLVGAIAVADSFTIGRVRSGTSYLAAGLVVVVSLLISNAARDYYRYLGGSKRRLGDYPAAIAAYRRVVQIAPGWAPGHNSLANLFRRTEKWDEAVVRYEKAIHLDPTDWRPHLGLALVFHELERGPEAIQAAERGLELLPEPSGSRKDSILRSNRDRLRRIRDHWKRKDAR